MIILDTNVISALMRQQTDTAVLEWLDRQPPESVWTSSITVFEIRFGLEIMAAGKKRRTLEEAFETMLAEDLDGRVVALDDAAAQEAGRMAAERRGAGRPIEIRDVLIAGVAVARRAAIATRNIRHFEGLGITLIDPWNS